MSEQEKRQIIFPKKTDGWGVVSISSSFFVLYFSRKLFSGWDAISPNRAFESFYCFALLHTIFFHWPDDYFSSVQEIHNVTDNRIGCGYHSFFRFTFNFETNGK